MDLSVLCRGFVATASTFLEYLAILVSVYLHMLHSDGRVAPHWYTSILYVFLIHIHVRAHWGPRRLCYTCRWASQLVSVRPRCSFTPWWTSRAPRSPLSLASWNPISRNVFHVSHRCDIPFNRWDIAICFGQVLFVVSESIFRMLGLCCFGWEHMLACGHARLNPMKFSA